MKHIYNLALIFAVCAAISSCLKGSTNPTQPTSSKLVGDWHLVNDNTTISFWGLWSGRPDTTINYAGQPADHYNFLPNGKLYVRDDNVIDTATYTLSKDTVIALDYSFIDGTEVVNLDTVYSHKANYMIRSITAHTLTLIGPALVSPETAFFHTIYLEK